MGWLACCEQAYTEDGVAVAVKMLSLRGMNDWKQLQLFEREASTLRALNHPGIPKYLDYFEEDSEADRKFYLVQVGTTGEGMEDSIPHLIIPSFRYG
jgi:serine/threonine protein kinase